MLGSCSLTHQCCMLSCIFAAGTVTKVTFRSALQPSAELRHVATGDRLQLVEFALVLRQHDLSPYGGGGRVCKQLMEPPAGLLHSLHRARQVLVVIAKVAGLPATAWQLINRCYLLRHVG